MSLAGHLICAVPQLQDPNFRRSVILLLDHSEEGAIGLVINNPMSTTVREVANSLELEWGGSDQEQVRLGGPVEPVRGWILHQQKDWDPESTELLPGLYLTTSLEAVLQLQKTNFGGQEHRFLFLLGYAGWGPGQLEEEIAGGSWVAVPFVENSKSSGIQSGWIFEQDPEEMWSSAFEALGVDPSRLVGMHSERGMMH